MRTKKGIALISVLTILTLATILVLTFFTLAENEMNASNNYAGGVQAKNLSDTAINLVIGQLRKATAEGDRVWASQPGAIRTWDMTGDFDTGYKLFSSRRMEVPAGEESALVNEDFTRLAAWERELWRYGDLNEPVVRGDTAYYPIVDPHARDYPNWPRQVGNDNKGVEGFDYDLSQVGKSPMAEPVMNLTGRDVLPMPVEWMYQLEDGTLGYLDDGRKFVPVSGGSNPTRDNPIVGRVAFWTDDETSKLNINANVGGAAWETPRASGYTDRDMARHQPAQREFQRYAGHPATTSLSPVLTPGAKAIHTNRTAMEFVFHIVPRVVGGGSASGTKLVNWKNKLESNGLIPDKDRLYPSLDDLILKPGGDRGLDHTDPNVAIETREPNRFPAAHAKATSWEELTTEEIQAILERSRFFLSAKSRSPEVTVFNTPRVSIWPTFDAQSETEYETYLTPFDKTIRFAGELGVDGSGDRYKYHFQRRNADSTTLDYTAIPRNQDLYRYLVELTSLDIPGFGASIRTKYGQRNQHQLITQMFDYIRSTNLFDDTVYDMLDPSDSNSWRQAYVPSGNNDGEHLTYTNYRIQSATAGGMHMGHGQVAPIRINEGGIDTKGYGRFFTVAEVAVQLIACADGNEGQSDGAIRGQQWHIPNMAIETGPDIPQEQNHQISNFPPIPYAGVKRRSDGEYDDGMGNMKKWDVFDNPVWPIPGAVENEVVSTWPDWLERLYNETKNDPNRVKLVEAAFYEGNWNFMLAWESPGFKNRAVNNQVDGRVIRDFLPEGGNIPGLQQGQCGYRPSSRKRREARSGCPPHPNFLSQQGLDSHSAGLPADRGYERVQFHGCGWERSGLQGLRL